jgi:DNA-binding protein YbaB
MAADATPIHRKTLRKFSTRKRAKKNFEETKKMKNERHVIDTFLENANTLYGTLMKFISLLRVALNRPRRSCVPVEPLTNHFILVLDTATMRITLVALFATTAGAFSPQLHLVGRTSTTSLSLFGGGGGGGGKKGPGMMDQLAMFKKAQEVAQKKAALDKELQEEDFQGTAADGKVIANFKYVPIKNPMDPNPDYELVDLSLDDAFFEESSPEDLSAAIQAAYTDGVDACNKAVMEKYQSLTAELSDVFGGAAPPA